MPPSKSSPFRLCVEGGDDKFVVVELVMRLLGRDWERDAESLPFIDDRAGISALLDRNELGRARRATVASASCSMQTTT